MPRSVAMHSSCQGIKIFEIPIFMTRNQTRGFLICQQLLCRASPCKHSQAVCVVNVRTAEQLEVNHRLLLCAFCCCLTKTLHYHCLDCVSRLSSCLSASSSCSAACCLQRCP